MVQRKLLLLCITVTLVASLLSEEYDAGAAACAWPGSNETMTTLVVESIQSKLDTVVARHPDLEVLIYGVIIHDWLVLGKLKTSSRRFCSVQNMVFRCFMRVLVPSKQTWLIQAQAICLLLQPSRFIGRCLNSFSFVLMTSALQINKIRVGPVKHVTAFYDNTTLLHVNLDPLVLTFISTSGLIIYFCHVEAP